MDCASVNISFSQVRTEILNKIEYICWVDDGPGMDSVTNSPVRSEGGPGVAFVLRISSYVRISHILFRVEASHSFITSRPINYRIPLFIGRRTAFMCYYKTGPNQRSDPKHIRGYYRFYTSTRSFTMRGPLGRRNLLRSASGRSWTKPPAGVDAPDHSRRSSRLRRPKPWCRMKQRASPRLLQTSRDPPTSSTEVVLPDEAVRFVTSFANSARSTDFVDRSRVAGRSSALRCILCKRLRARRPD